MPLDTRRGSRARIWQARRVNTPVDREGGFTLIELIIVVAILPLVVGAISVALLSVLKSNNATTSKVSNSGDTSVLSAVFIKDVQSAQFLTLPPYATSSSPGACQTTSPLLSLQWPSNSTVIVSYAVVQTGTNNWSLYRYFCEGLIQTTSVVAHNVQSGLSATVSGASCTQNGCIANAEPGTAQSMWASAVGVSGVQLTVNASEQLSTGTTTYSYTLTAVPRVSNNVSRGGTQPGHASLISLGTGSPGISCVGHDTLNVNGTASVNSTGTPAVQTTGNAAVSATSIYTNTSGSSGAFSGSNITPTTPTQTGVSSADPYAGMPTPVTEPIPNTVVVGSTYEGYTVFGDSNLASDGPGIYLNSVSVTSAMTIPSGIYIFQNGLSFSGNGLIQSAPGGVFFYVYSGAVSITGNGGVDLQPLASPPSPSADLTIWQDQSDTSGMSLGGNGAATVIGGTIYAPTISAGVGGNGTLDIGSLVVNSVSCNGGGNAGQININYGGSAGG
jgi:prepilin-type N-terminal cleavage/methylation domain-containing protein